MIILGIDPGTASTGYGVIQLISGRKKSFKCLGYGLIKTDPKFTPAERLKTLNGELDRLIKNYKPGVLAIESLYFFKNFKTAIAVSQAGGVILFTAAKNKIPVFNYTPLQVKLKVAGFGWAEKKEVQKKIRKILKLKEDIKPDDVTDALAIALTHLKNTTEKKIGTA